MPLYIDPQDVILRMQVNASLEGVVETISSAIQGAQMQVQSLLDGQLGIVEQDCLYFLDSDAFSQLQPGGLFRLEIPSGFVRQDSPVTVNYDTAWLMPNSATANPLLYKIDYNRGFLLMDARAYGDRFIQVQCTTGFKSSVPTPPFLTQPVTYDPAAAYVPGATVTAVGMTYLCIAPSMGNVPPNILYWTPVAYGPEVIPPEVYEAIMSYVPVVFDASQTTNRNQQAVPQYQKAADHAMMLLKSYMRMRGFAFRPLVR